MQTASHDLYFQYFRVQNEYKTWKESDQLQKSRGFMFNTFTGQNKTETYECSQAEKNMHYVRAES